MQKQGKREERWEELPRDVAIPLLVEREAGRLHALAKRFCGDDAEAEDIVQETFLSAWRAWDDFEGRAEPSTWLYTIASRACGKMHRKRSGEPDEMASLDELLPFGDDLVAVLPHQEGTPLDEELAREARDRVASAIVALPRDFRMPMVLKEVLGFSVEQVATVLGLPEGTVKSRLHRGRLGVRRALEDVLPLRELPPPAYDRQVCLDLLGAKQEALDRGVAFPGTEELDCVRCREIFRTMDLELELCQALGESTRNGDPARQQARIARLRQALAAADD